MDKGSHNNDILNNKWEIKKMIGKGSFSSIFVAKSITEPKGSPHYYVAIKRQSSGFETVIRWESDVLRALSLKLPVEGQGPIPVPRFIYSCAEYVAMELLSGEDMSALRNRVRNTSINGLIPIPSVGYLCINILKALEFVHVSGYVHRDVKPANFVRRSPKSTEFCIIDFGITKQYLDREGKVRPEKPDKDFRGTTQYASPFVHIHNADQCPRDDLFSLFFVMADMLCGQLPWTAATRSRDKATVIESKRQVFEDPSKMVSWIVDYMNEANEKIGRPFDSELTLSQEAQEGILQFFNHLKGLGYADTPNYNLIKEILVQMMQPQLHNVKSLEYTYHGFSWKGGVDKLQFTSSTNSTPAVVSSSSANPTSSAVTSVDPLDPQAIIRSKLQSLLESLPEGAAGKDSNGSLTLAQRLISLPQSDWSSARIFRNLLRELFDLPERKISRETVDVFRKVLVHHASFYNIEWTTQQDGGDDQGSHDQRQKQEADKKDRDEWAEFVDIQNLIGGFYDLYARVHKRPRELVTLSTLSSVEGLLFQQDGSPTKRTPYHY